MSHSEELSQKQQEEFRTEALQALLKKKVETSELVDTSYQITLTTASIIPTKTYTSGSTGFVYKYTPSENSLAGDSYVKSDNGTAIIHGGDGDDVLWNRYGDQEIYGGNGDDYIFGKYKGILDGGAGNDIVRGYTGTHTFIYTVHENIGFKDIYKAGGGYDTLEIRVSYEVYQTSWFQSAYQGAIQHISKNRHAEFDFSEYGAPSGLLDLTMNSMDKVSIKIIDPDTYKGPARDHAHMTFKNSDIKVRLGEGDDSILADYGSAIIYGNGGNDNLWARYNDHEIYGGAGDDYIFGKYNGILDGGSGSDTVRGYTGTHTFIYHMEENKGATDIYHAGGGTDTLELRVTDKIAESDWFQEAVEAFKQHIETDKHAIFDFKEFGESVSFFDLTAASFDAVRVVIVESIIKNSPPENVQLDNRNIDELSSIGQIIGTVSAEDPDGDTLSYSLEDDAGGLFTIHAETGVITLLRNNLDYESQPNYQVKVKVTDSEGNAVQHTFVIDVNDINEAPWQVTLSENSIMEDADSGTVIGYVDSVNDEGDSVSYSLLDDDGGLFDIDAETGALRLADNQQLDYETATSHTVSVRVTDQAGLFTDTTFTVHVGDVDENIPDTDFKYDGTLSGYGQTVVIIDSGIAYDLDVFEGRVVGGHVTAFGEDDIYDSGERGHGTHVAGIIASDGDAYHGWAPKVDIAVVKIFGESYAGSVSGSLRWVSDNIDTFENKITTVNMSLSASAKESESDTSYFFNTYLKQLEDAGVFTAVSAGNDYTSGKEGTFAPANSIHTVAVASHTSSSRMSYFSNRDDDVIVARGSSVQSYVPKEEYSDSNGLAYMSGTSMAAPQVAGAAIMIRELMEIVGYENVTQDMIYDHMRATATSIYDSTTGKSYAKLHGRRAVESLMPEDEYGDDSSDATYLGQLSDDSAFTGFLDIDFAHESISYGNGKIVGIDEVDVDAFNFTATQTGTLTLSLVNKGVSKIDLAWLEASDGDADGMDLVLEVVEGQEYYVALTTETGIGYYEMRADYDMSEESSILSQEIVEESSIFIS